MSDETKAPWTGFTPGDPVTGMWDWSKDYPTADGRETWSLIGGKGYGISSCDGLENSPQEVHRTNAELIRRAPLIPELLGMLERMYEVSGNHAAENPKQVRLEARALIAKVRGAGE